LERRNPQGHLVRSLDDLEECGIQSSPKIRDHCSGESFSFKTSLSSFSGVREAFEDISDIIHPSVVHST
jgi:hypothetical protein